MTSFTSLLAAASALFAVVAADTVTGSISYSGLGYTLGCVDATGYYNGDHASNCGFFTMDSPTSNGLYTLSAANGLCGIVDNNLTCNDEVTPELFTLGQYHDIFYNGVGFETSYSTNSFVWVSEPQSAGDGIYIG